MSHKYVLCPGFVFTPNCKTTTYITALQLAEWYDVPTAECLVRPSDLMRRRAFDATHGAEYLNTLIWLTIQFGDDDYVIPTEPGKPEWM